MGIDQSLRGAREGARGGTGPWSARSLRREIGCGAEFVADGLVRVMWRRGWSIAPNGRGLYGLRCCASKVISATHFPGGLMRLRRPECTRLRRPERSDRSNSTPVVVTCLLTLDVVLFAAVVSAALGHGFCAALGGPQCGTRAAVHRLVIAFAATSVTGGLCHWWRRPASAAFQLILALLYGLSAVNTH